MSKAFTLEDSAAPEHVLVRPLELNEGTENYITRQGFESLKTEVSLLQKERDELVEADRATEESHLMELENRIQFLTSRLDRALVVNPEDNAGERVVFGSRVVVEGEDGEHHRYQLVGIDETDAKIGKISWISPMGKSLLRAKVGDFVIVKSPRGEEEFEVKEIAFS